MRRFFLVCLTMIIGVLPLRADTPGVFDYYVLALSWSPSWCDGSPGRSRAMQCDRDADHGFILHGLWPQYLEGWPAECRTDERAPSRREVTDMLDITPSRGLLIHEWERHGTCSGLSAAGYFEIARQAYERIERPDILRQVTRVLTLNPTVIEAAFAEANPGLATDMMTVKCEGGRISELRICLTRDLDFRICEPDVARDCTGSALFPPLR